MHGDEWKRLSGYCAQRPVDAVFPQGVTRRVGADYNKDGMTIFGHKPDCWLRDIVCPRRYRATLPALVRANLFAGD